MKLENMFGYVPKLALLGAVICAVVIAVLSLLPGSDLPATNMNDKLNHFIAYGVLMALATLGRGRVRLLAIIAGIILYGLVLEGLQGMMPYGRSASWIDALANTGGVLIGAGVGALLARGLAKIGQS